MTHTPPTGPGTVNGSRPLLDPHGEDRVIPLQEAEKMRKTLARWRDRLEGMLHAVIDDDGERVTDFVEDLELARNPAGRSEGRTVIPA